MFSSDKEDLMTKKVRTMEASSSRIHLIWIIGALVVVVGGVGSVLFFSLNRGHPPASPPPAATFAIQPPRTAPDLVVQQYCSDLSSHNYDNAYTLLTSNVHKQLDPRGGAIYLAQIYHQFDSKYGEITSCQVTQVSDPSGGFGSKAATVKVQIDRQHFQSNQQETDTFNLVLEPDGWAIDKWESDVSNG
jgi:hypothetical protein